MQELTNLCRQHPEIGTCRAKIDKTGRLPVMAEFEACQDHAEEQRHANSDQ